MLDRIKRNYLLLFVIAFSIFTVGIDLAAQEKRAGQTNKKISGEFTVGNALFLFATVEGALKREFKLADKFSLQARVPFGYMNQLLMFDGQDEPGRVIYMGSTIGFLWGGVKDKLEINIGPTFYYRLSGETYFEPKYVFSGTASIGLFINGKRLAYRLGFDFPKGAYLGVVF